MLKPIVALIAALVAKSPDAPGKRLVARNDDPAFAGSDLLVGVKREDAGVAHGTNPTAAVLCPDGLAGILNHQQPVPLGDFENGRHLRRNSERMDGKNSPRPGRDRFFDPLWVDVQSARINVGKHWGRTFIANGVGGGDESERGNDHLVALSDAERAN